MLLNNGLTTFVKLKKNKNSRTNRLRTLLRNAISVVHQNLLTGNTSSVPHVRKPSIVVLIARSMTGKRSTKLNARNYKPRNDE